MPPFFQQLEKKLRLEDALPPRISGQSLRGCGKLCCDQSERDAFWPMHLNSPLLYHHRYVDRLNYAIQFARRPPKFRGTLKTSVAIRETLVLREAIAVLLVKDAIELVPPAEMRQGIYSPYFIIPKKALYGKWTSGSSTVSSRASV